MPAAHEQGIGLDCTYRRKDVVRLDLLPCLQNERGRASIPGDYAADPAAHSPFPARLPVLVDKEPQDRAYALEGPGQALEEHGLEEHGELAEIHVVFLRASIEKRDAQEHVGKDRVAHIFADNRPRREGRGVRGEARRPDAPGEPLKAAGLPGEGAGDFRFKHAEVIGEPKRQFAPRTEGDPRLALLAKTEFIAVQP